MQTQIMEIFAIVGAVYVVARIIVTLTPTPKDDIALEKVGVLLKTLAKVAGLDLKQGVEKKDKSPEDVGVK